MGRRAAITGGAGFVGSHLAELLLSQGNEVTIVDNFSTGRAENLAGIVEHPRLRVVRHDVEDEAALDEVLRGQDVVFHLAAALGVEFVVNYPVETINANVGATERLLRCARRHGVRTLLASTSEVYGKGVRLPFTESDDVVLGATSRSRWCYAASKMIDEFLGLGYHTQYGLPVTVFRLFNTVGPRQRGRYGMVVPRFVEAALAGKALQVHGDGGQSRSFLHVRDAVRAIAALSESPGAVGEVFNVGAMEPITILELAETVLRKVESAVGPTGATLELVPYEQVYGPGFEDMRQRVPNTAKIEALTGWAPRCDLDVILDDVIAGSAAASPAAHPAGLVA